ncbi:MAG TPA: response regulator transcription factor [Solirubrobacteraceae bacterium]|jgi:DNA-binding NarL/FixJ family response regulator|nr:response regulator transcription factor [Solirubrobacteraceae bacterium]
MSGTAREGGEGSVTADRPIRVIIAEDSYLVRESLSQMIGEEPGIELVAVCDDAEDLLAKIESLDPDVVITDIRMPPSGGEEGIRIAQRLRRTHPQTGVVVLSQYAEPTYALALLDEGAGGRSYLLKQNMHNRRELVDTIEEVAAGGSRIDALVVETLVRAQSRQARSPLAGLTPRERELLAEIAQGKSNAAIADSLVITKRAVEKHVNSIFLKLGLAQSEGVSSRRVKATLMFLADEDAGRTSDP